MRLFYCPVCGKEEIRSDDPYKNERTISNLRDGYGRPITHYKCECGNYLAGSMSISGWGDFMIQYCKDTIRGYNKGGCYYAGTFSPDGGDCDFSEKAKQCYEKRKEDAKQKEAQLLTEVHWFEQCDKNDGDKCEHGRCVKAILSLGGENSGFFCGRGCK